MEWQQHLVNAQTLVNRAVFEMNRPYWTRYDTGNMVRKTIDLAYIDDQLHATLDEIKRVRKQIKAAMVQ